jgi:hypothetical protein
MKIFKARASMMGALFTEPRAKKDLLSATCESYLQEWYLENKWGIKSGFSSKYTDKGISMEEEAISMYNRVFYANCVKNDEWFEDEYCTGTPDIVTDDEIIDIKNSFSVKTFPFFDKNLPNKGYFYQLQTYMRLTGKSKAKIVYCLLDTPEDIIEREAKSVMYKENLPDDFYDILLEEIREQHTYGHIPEEERIKVFEVLRDDNIIEMIESKVKICREFIDNSF